MTLTLNTVIYLKIMSVRTGHCAKHSAVKLARGSSSAVSCAYRVAMETRGLLFFTLLVTCGYMKTLHSAPSSRDIRSATENVVFERGTCRGCHKILVRDSIIRCAPRNNASYVSSLVSYDGVGCCREEQIACVRVTDRSEGGEGANVTVKSGDVQQPFIKLNITSHQGKGYHLFLEIRGLDPKNPDCK